MKRRLDIIVAQDRVLSGTAASSHCHLSCRVETAENGAAPSQLFDPIRFWVALTRPRRINENG